MKYTFKKLSENKDKFEYEVIVDFKELEPFKEIAFKELAKDVKLPGFRPGKAPKEKIEAEIGNKVISEAVGRLLPAVTLEVIQKEDLKPISAPEYNLEKMSDGDGVVFKFSIVNYPEVKLGDFSKIKVKKEEIKVTDEDADVVIRNIVRSSLKPEQIKELAGAKLSKSTKKSDTKKSTKADDSKEEDFDFELNDKLIAELKYDNEKTVADMRKSVKVKLKEMKSQQAENEYNNKVIEEAIKLSKMEIPDLFIDREAAGAERQFTDRLKELKLEPETYLATQGSSMEEKRKEWKEQAEKRVSIDLLLIAIANEHKEVASDKDIDEEIENIEDPKVKAQYGTSNAREYVRTIITRQRGMKRLLAQVEGEKKATSKAKKTKKAA